MERDGYSREIELVPHAELPARLEQVLSVLYLVAGVALESLLRWWPAEWVEQAARVMDSLPLRSLSLVGALPLLRALYVAQVLPNWALRAIFGATTVLIIFLLAFVVGAGMYAVQRLVEWSEDQAASPRR